MKTVIKSIFSVILSVLIFLSAFVTIATAVVKFRLTNVERYVETVITDEYVDELYNDVYNNTSLVCENLEVHRDTVMSFVNKDELKRISQINFRETFSSLISGAPLEYECFENEDLKDEIYKELESFANEAGIVDEDISEATDLTYDFIVDDINATLTYFTQDNMNSVSFVSRMPGLDFISNDLFYVCLVVLIVLCVLKFLISCRKRALSATYNVSFMLWLASACWFIPITVIKLHNIAVNIAIAYSGFRLYVQNLINTVVDGFFSISLLCFVVTSILLVASIVTIIVFAVRGNKKAIEKSTQEN